MNLNPDPNLSKSATPLNAGLSLTFDADVAANCLSVTRTFQGKIIKSLGKRLDLYLWEIFHQDGVYHNFLPFDRVFFKSLRPHGLADGREFFLVSQSTLSIRKQSCLPLNSCRR